MANQDDPLIVDAVLNYVPSGFKLQETITYYPHGCLNCPFHQIRAEIDNFAGHPIYVISACTLGEAIEQSATRHQGDFNPGEDVEIILLAIADLLGSPGKLVVLEQCPSEISMLRAYHPVKFGNQHLFILFPVSADAGAEFSKTPHLVFAFELPSES